MNENRPDIDGCHVIPIPYRSAGIAPKHSMEFLICKFEIGQAALLTYRTDLRCHVLIYDTYVTARLGARVQGVISIAFLSSPNLPSKSCSIGKVLPLYASLDPTLFHACLVQSSHYQME
ncbi:hypothetical protein VTP01DRAFT_9053 [Rhizomucor pusillus]|uniref:uncharacterized protein n=1 Tax=Rhizomucor pusillus TaxID=4840 RepID=UPI00374386AE